MEADLQQLRKLLSESQRLATIGTIAAVIAHEFNNLLTPVVSYSQFALQSLRSGQPDWTLIEKALTKSALAGEKAGRICGSMLGLARGQGDFGPVEVMKLVEEVLAVLARDPAKDGIALRVQVTPGLKVVGDSVQLEQVLLNLLINARQAMLSQGRSGSLTVRGEADLDHREAVLSVSDTGPGIAPEHLPRIFEPFFTTKTAAPRGQLRGTGLGLAICKQIVESHRGRIDVDSQVGRGTTFTVRLPLAA
ncbi:MAG: sensor histidine kinase [Tepidisphaerales bacterium]